MNMTYTKIFIDNVYIILKNKNIKMADFEKEIQVSPGYLSRCKNGKKRISIDTALSICKYLDIDFETLIDPKLCFFF